jgi:SPP1 family predicted phage head-tail adaptor
MRAGLLRHVLTIQARSLSQTAGGEISAGGWADVATVWGAVRPATVKEREVALQQQAVISHIITCRWHSQLAPEARLRFGSRTFEIHGIRNHDERGILARITCTEEVEG